MNKVFNINLGGYPFTIDEDAFEHLNVYLTSIHNHFRDSEGYEEITADIEARMAELFQEQLNGRPIVTTKDIKNAIAIMGTPQDFGAEPLDEPLYQEEEAGKRGKQKKYKTGKRLFRNSEDEVVGGVCSGLAAYFGIEDPLWIRLGWILITISGGLGIPAYIILWVIVPKAETAGDRLSMRGEKINVSNIGKIVEEEIETFSEKMEKFGNEFQSKKKRTGETGSKRFTGIGGAIKKGISLLGFVISRVLSVFTKIWKPIFFIVGFALIIALSVIWIMSIISFFIAFPYVNYIFAGSKLLSFLAVINILTFFGVPLLGVILFLTKHVFKTRTSPNFKAGMWAFWVVNIISLFGIGSYQASQFNSSSELIQGIDLSGISTDTLQLKIEADPYRSATFRIGDLKISDRQLISHHIHLNIEKADGDYFELSQEKHSRGSTENEALELVSSINYDLRIVDNTIILPKIIEIAKGVKWRNQFVELTLKVPEGKSIYIQNDLWPIGHHIDIDRTQEHPRFEAEQTWVMESNGLVNHAFIRKSQRSDEFNFINYDHLQLDGRIKVTIEKGDQYNIAMLGRPHYLDRVKVVQLDKTLSLSMTGNGYVTTPPRITITMPELNILEINKTEKVNVQGFTQKNMRVKHKGTEALEIFAKIDSFYLRQFNRSKTILKGQGGFMEAVLDRRSELDADRFSLEKAKIETGVSCDVSVSVADSLWIEKESGTQIDVDGSPVILEKNVFDH